MMLRPGLWSYISTRMDDRYYLVNRYKPHVSDGWSCLDVPIEEKNWDTGYDPDVVKPVDRLIIPLELI